MKRGFFKRLLCAIMVIAMLSAYAAPALADDGSKVKFEQVDNSAVSARLPGREPVEKKDETPAYADTDVVRVSIVLEKAATISAGYSPVNIAKNASAMNYRASLQKEQDKIIAKIEKATQKELDVVWNLTLAANLISANVEFGQIEAIENIRGVERVVIETRYTPDVSSSGGYDPNMATSSKQIGSVAAWAAGYTGAGSRIAVIDTGTDTDHQSFDAGAFEYSLGLLAEKAGMTKAAYIESLNLLDAAEIASVMDKLNISAYKPSAERMYISSKLPFGFNYVDVSYNVTHDYDDQGEHGSHVAGIATANAYIPSGSGYVNALESVMVQGVAPDAQLITMKVFGADGGAYDSDYMAAIEDAVVLNCDSVNLSLGSGNPGMSRPADAVYQEILDSLVGSGVVVAMSAGNSGSWADAAENGVPYLYLDDVSLQTDGSPGSFTNSLAVASVDNDGFVASFVSTAMGYTTYFESATYNNVEMSTIAGDHEYVFLNNIGTPEQFAALGEGALKGKIALCYRGETSFFEKANAAVSLGAIGVIIVNNVDEAIYLNLTGYEYTAPVVSVTLAAGEIFKDASGAIKDNSGNVLAWTGSLNISEKQAIQYESEYYTMSSFSSWGVPGSLVLKPEITAPGGSILSVYGGTPEGGGSTQYELMSGTSMASPQVAGMAAVLAQYIRENGLEAKTGLDARTLAQSLLMSTAVPMLGDADGSAYIYSVMQQGAGLANVGAAVMAESYILMGSDATASYADGKVKAELGDDPERSGVYSFSFTINNLTDVEKTYVLSADVFTQNAFGYEGALYLDTWTTTLGANVYWTVDGKAVSGGQEVAKLDFDGDGDVDTDDGQALLDYATGVRTELSNKELADLNEDGKINSYDSYLFFTLLGASGAVVPANGSVTVSVTIELTEAEKEFLDAYYTSGAYVEAYVYATSVADAEGVEGTTHSIPVLGFYGNWSDASMFDTVSYLEYRYKTYDHIPYLASSGALNGVTIVYADDPSNEYYFGGNPMVFDEVYMPERNAVRSVDNLGALFTQIRNAAASRVVITDMNGKALAWSDDMGPVSSAFYYVNAGEWYNTDYSMDIGTLDFVPEGMQVKVGVQLAPEYYVDNKGNVNWDALGAGATLSVPVVVDDTAPVVKDVKIDKENNVLVVTVTDENYISAVALFDSTGEYVFAVEGSKADAEAGDTLTYELDLTGVNGSKFLLQVFDYATNVVTYEINTQIGEVYDGITGISLNKKALNMATGTSETLIATVDPVNAVNRNVIWSSSNSAVATVDQNGKVTAVSEGSAVITATAEADSNYTAECTVNVITVAITLEGALQDEAGYPMTFVWNMETDSTWTPVKNFAVDIASAAFDSYGGYLYVQNNDFVMYKIDPATGETVAKSGVSEFGAPMADIAVLEYFCIDDETPLMMGVYGSYLLAPDDPMVNGFTSGWNLASYLSKYTGASRFVAIASGGVVEDEGEYCDFLYALDNAGYMWVFWYNGTGSLSLNYFKTDLNISYEGYCSMVEDHETGVLAVANFNSAAGTSEIYYLEFNGSGFSSLLVGNVGKDVWPAALTGLSYNGTAANANAAITAAFEIGEEAYESNITIASNEVVGGSLNAASKYTATSRPQSVIGVGEDEDTIVVKVTAKDATGADVESTNGVSTVTYDADKLELVSIKVNGDYISVNEKTGSVTFGYVELSGFAAGDTVATLIFKVKDEGAQAVTVKHDEVNDELPGYEENLDMDCAHANTEIRNAKDATCTEEGYTGDVYCVDCGELITKGKVIPASGHDMGEWTESKPATCTEKGEEKRTCKNCDHFETRETEAKGHDMGEWTESKAATCTEKGEEKRTCKNCDHFETRETEALGHDMGDWIVTDPGSCTEKGTEKRTCKRCDYYETRETESEGHEYGEWVQTKAPTCTEKGEEKRTCKYCDHFETREIDALGHDFGEWVETKPATCTEKGEEKRTCKRCDHFETRETETKAHDFGEWVETKAPTCTEKGEEKRTCKNCDHFETREIEATGHDYEHVVTPPTETERGYTTHTCKKCGHSYVDSYVDPDDPSKTADSFKAIWFALMIVSLFGTVALVSTRKKWFVK